MLTTSTCSFFYYYRDIAGAIYPVLEDVPQFEMNLHLLLSNRASMGGVYRADADQSQKPFGVTIAYMGLLFAVLASGCQSSDLPGKERELTSQVYGSSFSTLISSTLTDYSSVLLIPVSSYDQLPLAADDRCHANTTRHWQRLVVQYEPRNFLRASWYDASDGLSSRSTCRVQSLLSCRALSPPPRLVC